MTLIAPDLNTSFHTEMKKRGEFQELYGLREVDVNRGEGGIRSMHENQ